MKRRKRLEAQGHGSTLDTAPSKFLIDMLELVNWEGEYGALNCFLAIIIIIFVHGKLVIFLSFFLLIILSDTKMPQIAFFNERRAKDKTR
jgi:hypothetical protein